jgi:hypothetical protein
MRRLVRIEADALANFAIELGPVEYPIVLRQTFDESLGEDRMPTGDDLKGFHVALREGGDFIWCGVLMGRLTGAEQ